jgi:hypothetical protein
MKKFLTFLILLSQIVLAQSTNADKILEKVKMNFDAIQDYVVDVKGKVDFPDAVIPELQAKIYFKKPDKFKVESKSFMLLPKQAIRFGPDMLFKQDFSSVYIGETEIDNIKHFIIKVIPNNPESEEVVTLWINSSNYTIRKLSGINSRSGKIEAEFFNKLIDGKYWLPEKLKVDFEIKNLRMIRQRKLDKDLKILDDSPKSGSIILNYTNYIVNRGIDDKIFTEKER